MDKEKKDLEQNFSVAVYYPHTSFARSPHILHSSLFLWDHVECIVPRHDFNLKDGLSNEVAEAVELIAKPIQVNDRARESLYQNLNSLVGRGVPDWLTNDTPPKSELSDEVLQNLYPMYSEKLNFNIIELLKENKLAKFSGADEDIYTNPVLGLLMMSLLAQEMAGNTKHIFTDRTSAYNWIAKFAFEESLGKQIEKPLRNNIQLDLHHHTLKILDFSKIPLSSIIKLRKKEATSTSGADYRNLRHNYLKTIQDFSAQIAIQEKPADQEELIRQYSQKVKDDMRVLKDDLNENMLDALTSSHTQIAFAVSAVATGVGIPTLPTLLASGLSLLGGWNKWQVNKSDVLEKHPMSWLYMAK